MARISLLLGKAKAAYEQQRFFHALYSRLKPYLWGSRYLIHNPSAKTVSIHCPDYVVPSQEKSELEIVGRIFRSFKKMKEGQRGAPKCYLPSSQWQGYLDNYSLLNSGLQANDLGSFHYFLANFGAWREYHAVESTTVITENVKSLVRRRYLENVIFFDQLKVWRWFYDDRRTVARLSYPMHGNQAGAYIDGVFVGAGSFFNEIYGSILSGLVDDRSKPVVAELGAGYGKLAYFTLRDMRRFTFVDFDLPETLCLAAYYLMKVWPERKVLLYGEEEYSPLSHARYDLIFMPCYEIAKLGVSSVDLFINKNSLGEMAKESVTNYIHHITKATRYFFHANHEVVPQVYSDGSLGMLGYEYPVPRDRFKLLFRLPEVGRLLQQGRRDARSDIFLNLYERRTEGGVER